MSAGAAPGTPYRSAYEGMSVWYTATDGMPSVSAAASPRQPSTNGEARCTTSAPCSRMTEASRWALASVTRTSG